MRCGNARRAAVAIAFAIIAAFWGRPSSASPWADVGDAQLRSDIEVLAAAGLIDDVTTQWPLAWGGVVTRLEQADDLEDQPDYVQAAAERVEAEGEEALQTHRIKYAVSTDFTNLPDVVRGFDALGREDVQGDVSAEWMGDSTAIKLQAGGQTLNRYDKQSLMLDGSYIAQRIGNIAVNVGYVMHWWGPGWDTALSLSNNARPFPQIGYRRLDTRPFDTPWLSWLGPWNHEMFIGVLDDPRRARNTVFHGMRWAFNPLPGFEFALAHLQELCGTGHPCEPFEEFFNVQNGPAHQSKSKDETNFDFRYTNTFEGLTYALYNQEMDRDTGPFVHSDTSHLFGASLWVPVRRTSVRFTAEYADTISTDNFFSFGKDFYGQTYSDFKYTDGWQYRGRTLGSSLDTDSRLASFHASWLGGHDITYTLTYYCAWVSSPQTAAGHEKLVGPGISPTSGNLVTTAPVKIDIGEARLRVPFRSLSIELAARIQSDQPRPDKGFAAAAELSINYRL